MNVENKIIYIEKELDQKWSRNLRGSPWSHISKIETWNHSIT